MVETQQMLTRSRRHGNNAWKNYMKKDLNEPDYYDDMVITQSQTFWSAKSTGP